ncbi:hypothetical protein BU26DRAFT_154322 [Trematosphaeria pertusa]|uniref:Uncharacterized protein n=1 Tax=Trematosphaeria pertusa TaxID=390896 RepID=A0A6A6J0H4_9PLEO|nr:uncharacterized protein BU26DRAFT_154322 [Trematosphaeria pertusa]KAF2255350.1 hypothetical protein BU26DRAFT_154322 [Trematosphaeria pertusa]
MPSSRRRNAKAKKRKADKATSHGIDEDNKPKRQKTSEGALHQSTPADPLDQSPFFKLPLELRNMVYHELWQATPRIRVDSNPSVRRDRTVAYLIYDGASREEGGFSWSSVRGGWTLPLWLRTSKAFLDEGVAQLRLKGYWHLDFLFSREFAFARPRGLPLFPTTALTIEDVALRQVMPTQSKNQFTLFPADAAWLLQLSRLPCLAKNLKKLRFQARFSLSRSSHPVLPQDIELDLSPLYPLATALEQLHTLEVVIGDYLVDWNPDSRELLRSIQQQAILDLAQAFWGDKVAVTKTKVEGSSMRAKQHEWWLHRLERRAS